MSRTSGTYTAPSNSWNPAVQGTTVDEADWNSTLEDIETALTESVYTGGLGSTDNRLVRTDGTDTKKVQGSAIAVDDSGNMTGVGTINGTWRVPTYSFNPQTYGATGDGTTNDRAALAAADTAAAALTADGIVEIGPGTYLVSSNVTLSSNIVMAGGILKPASGITITLGGSFRAPRYQCFDTSAGGFIAGTPSLDNDIYPEWWGAVANRATDCTAALQAALNFQAQYSRGALSSVMGYSTPVSLHTGTYRISSSLTIEHNGSAIVGNGQWSSAIEVDHASGIVAIDVIEQWGGINSAFGHYFKNFQINGGFDAAGTQRTAGAGIRMTYIRGATIEDVYFRGNFVGVRMEGCKFGGPRKTVNRCYFYGHDGTVVSGSAHIMLTMTAAAIGAAEVEKHCSHVTITNCHGDGTATQNGLAIYACDTPTVQHCHFFAADNAQLLIDNTNGPVINGHYVNNTWEVGVANGTYAMQVTGSNGGTYSHFFANDQFLNGTTCCILLASSVAERFGFTNCTIQQGGVDNVRITAGSNFQFSNCISEDPNWTNTSTTAHFKIDGAVEEVDIVNTQMFVRDSGQNPDYGVAVLAATGGIRVSGGSIKNFDSYAIINADASSKLTVTSVSTSESTTVASATTIFPPLGVAQISVTGTTTIDSIDDSAAGGNASSVDREILMTFASGLTVRNAGGGTGNIRTVNSQDAAMPSGSWMILQYDSGGVWREKSRGGYTSAGMPWTKTQGQSVLGLPTSTTDNGVPRFDGTTGSMQTSAATISDAGRLSLTGTGISDPAIIGSDQTTTYLQVSNSTSAYMLFGPRSTTESFVQASAGKVVFEAPASALADLKGKEVRAGGDTGGEASTVSLTNTVDSAARSTGVGTVKFDDATARDSAGFVKLYNGTTAIYVPYWTAI